MNISSRSARALVGALSATALILPLSACNNDAANSGEDASAAPAASVDINRTATGDLTATGGARRQNGDQTDVLKKAIETTGAKNVILLIGDGMGDSEITAARNYAVGASGSFAGIDALPVTGQYTHYSLDKEGKPNYVTDSAASATAWATGTKTNNGAIGVDIHGKPMTNLIEKAKAKGLATGNVSTAAIQDATPAAQVAHVSKRSCFGPDDADKCGEDLLEKGGRGSISEQILDARADVTLGGGSQSFNQKAKAGDWKDKTLLEQAKERGYQLPTNLDELNAITAANQDSPVLGLFDESHMPLRWQGDKAEKGGYLKPAITCSDNAERPAEVPTLATMTSKAIGLLDASNKGFFLQVEGASIDKQDHASNPCGQIGETVDFDEAVQEALKFAKNDGKTLVIVTADHAQTSQIVAPMTEEDVAKMAEEAGVSKQEAADSIYPGLTRNLITKDGSVMTMSYALSTNTDVLDQGHTGTQLRVAAYGPNAANIAGLTDQTDLHFTIADALGL